MLMKNTPYATANDIDSLIASLEQTSKSLFTWFDNNLMKNNADKCHLLVSSNEKVTIKIGSHEIANTKREKLLGVHLDSGLSFDYHISEICKKASRKVCALARVTSGMSLSKKRSLINAFFNHSLTIVHLFGCAIVARITIKSIDFMKGVQELYTMISDRHLMHF